MLFLLLILFLSILIKQTKIKPYTFLLILNGLLLGILSKYTDTIYNSSLNYWINIHPQTFLFYFIPPLIFINFVKIYF